MRLDMDGLLKCFDEAIDKDMKYVAVMVKNENCEGMELIINPKENFLDKREYYKKAYTDELILKTYYKIRIVGFVYGDSLEEIENKIKVLTIV